MVKKIKSFFKHSKNERGAILVVSLLVVVFMLILALPLLFRLTTQFRTTEKSYKSLAALNLAEAGVERAIWELNYGDISSWTGNSSLRSNTISSIQSAGGISVGSITIHVYDPEGNSPIVESTGNVPFVGAMTVDKTVRVVLEGQTSNSLFDYGIFGDEGVELRGNAFIDSYDSRDGAYGGSNVGQNGHTGTNATAVGCISLRNNSKIFGNALAGPGADPDSVILIQNNSHVYGSLRSLSETESMPSVTAPVGIPSRGEFDLGSNRTATISESGQYSSFSVSSNSTVTITESVTLYVTGAFSLSSNAELIIASGVSVTMYFGGTFTEHSNASINNLTQDPTKLQIYGTDSFNGAMEIRSNSDLWAAIYVPRAAVDINSNANIYGAVKARYIDIASNAHIHYDEALKELDTGFGETTTTYIVKSWQEKY
ncbi:MAG: hypothetical protein WCC06_11935 [Candidatus Aminicenantales bacterium]